MDATDRHPLVAAWKLAFALVVVLGLSAIAIGLVGLLDLPVPMLRDDATTSSGELVVAIGVGVLLVVFGATALAHGHAAVDANGLHFLSFGPWCRTDTIPLGDIERFGSETESRGYRRNRILVLGLRGGGRRKMIVSMFAGWDRLLEELGAALGQEPAAASDGWRGVNLD